MKKLTYLLMLLAALSGAAVYAGSLNNSFVCFGDEDDWSDAEEDMDDEDMDDEDADDEDDADEDED